MKSKNKTAVSTNTKGKMVVCTQVKDEVPYLFEWIAFHRALGVDQFDIYNHHSSDGLEKLPAMYDAAGKPYVSVLKAKDQVWSFNDCLRRHQDAAWVGIFDVDEFVSLQPNSSRPLCKGPQLKCFLDEKKKLGYDEVHFPALRFSSNHQVWRNPTPLEDRSSFIQNKPKIGKTQELDCQELSLRKKNNKKVNLCGGGDIPTIIGSHLFRGPSEHIGGENYAENFKKDSNCHTWDGKYHASAKVCKHGPGKSFVQPQKCEVYTVHGCHLHIPRFEVNVADARLNHYYTRSAEDACKHAKGWKNDAPLNVFKYVDDGFFKLIKDESALNSVSLTRLQEDMKSVMCQTNNLESF